MPHVLSLKPLTAGSHHYYEQVACGREDYYSAAVDAEEGGGEDPAGQWLGAGAEQLGLEGSVPKGALARMAEGEDPRTGRRLLARRAVAAAWVRCGPRGRARTARPVTGWDLTFSAPKSVSVVYAVGDSDLRAAVRHAHDQAVRDAVGYLERSACVTRRGAGGTDRHAGAGFVAAAFRHVASRAGDPQLHTHVVAANMTEAAKRWTRLDGASIYRHGRTAGFLYQASLRAGLSERLGVEWRPVRNGYADIEGIPEGVLIEFSRRRQAIEEELLRRGLSSARAAQFVTLETRESKDLATTPASLLAEWRARAAEHGLTEERLAKVLNRGPARTLSIDEVRAVGTRFSGPEGLTERRATFDRRDALQAWAERMVCATVSQVEDVTDQWLESSLAVRVDPEEEPGYEPLHSTPELLATEQRLLESARSRLGEGAVVVPDDLLAGVLQRHPTLSQEQTAMLRAVCCRGDGVQIVRGLAGTGKTFALSAARLAFNEAGIRVLGCAVQGKAALLLEQEARIPSGTLAKLLGLLREGAQLGDQTVVVVDEAAMAGTRELAELLDYAAGQRAKVVLVGDDRQLPELRAGGAFHGLAARIGAVELRQVRRQLDRSDVVDLLAIREGRALPALRSLERRGRLVTGTTADETLGKLIEAWRDGHARSYRDGPAVMIARRHRDVAELNAGARAALRRDGQLAGHVTVGAREFAIGDRVIAGRNNDHLGVRNGMMGVVAGIDPVAETVTVKMDAAGTVVLPYSYATAERRDGQLQLEHAYAITAYRSQGSTWGRSYILASEETFREEIYTVMSRHRHEATLFVTLTEDPVRPDLPLDATERLASAAGRSRAQRLASDQYEAMAMGEVPEGRLRQAWAGLRDRRGPGAM